MPLSKASTNGVKSMVRPSFVSVALVTDRRVCPPISTYYRTRPSTLVLISSFARRVGELGVTQKGRGPFTYISSRKSGEGRIGLSSRRSLVGSPISGASHLRALRLCRLNATGHYPDRTGQPRADGGKKAKAQPKSTTSALHPARVRGPFAKD